MKKCNIIKKILIITLIILITCSGCKEKSENENASTSKLKFNGIYCYINDLDKDGYKNNYVFRFYEDGSVIFASVSQTSKSKNYFPKKSWFNKKSNQYKEYIGKYKIDDDNISFTSISENGTVDYWGTISDTELLLSYHSNINGSSGDNRKYSFYSFEDIPNWD